jgi:hypothetical protein
LVNYKHRQHYLDTSHEGFHGFSAAFSKHRICPSGHATLVIQGDHGDRLDLSSDRTIHRATEDLDRAGTHSGANKTW